MVYSQLDDFSDYRELVTQFLKENMDTGDQSLPVNKLTKKTQPDHIVVVERIRPVTPLQNPSKFKCYLLTSPLDLSKLSTIKPFLTCKYSRGTGKLLMGESEILVGKLTNTNRGKQLFFHANQQQVLTMTIDLPDHIYHVYTMEYEGNNYEMSFPRDNNGQPTLKYHFIPTKKMGVESKNNFAMEKDTTSERMLECLKVADNQLMLAVRQPFNPLVASVVGILRYRGM